MRQFLKRKQFDLAQITNAREYCRQFTASYPLNLLVDRNGIVIDGLPGMPEIVVDGQRRCAFKMLTGELEKLVML